MQRGTVRVTSGPFTVYSGVRYDPVRRELRVLPNAPDLRPGLRYVFRVSDALRAWDGAALRARLEFPFVPEGRAEPVMSAPPSLRRDVAPLLRARCGNALCHGGEVPAMALDLSSAEGILRTAVGVIAAETSRGGSLPSYTDPQWGALYRIDPGDASGLGRPEYSYLIYKLLGDGPIIGLRMPPDAPLAARELELISDWISAGAPQN